MDRMPNTSRLTYANVVATLALFLALGGGAAFAASQLQPGAVHTSNIFKRAVTSGKLAVGAVRSNQIAEGAVGAAQIGNGAVGAKQVADGSIGLKQIAESAVGAKQVIPGSLGAKQIGAAAVVPANLEFPVFYAASPRGGSAAVTNGPDPYPISDGTWIQNPGQIEVLFGAAMATVAYDETSGEGSCQVFFEIDINGRQVGGGQISTSSTSLQQIEESVGAQPQIDPVTQITNHLVVRTGSNGGCTSDSEIDSARFRVLDFG